MRAAVAKILLAGSSAAIGVALVNACTLAVSFDDQPSCDGGLCDDSGAFAQDGARDSSAGFDGGADAARDAAADVFDPSYLPCKGLKSGLYCGGDHLVAYRGPSTDLVTCDGGAIAKVRPCGDAGCIAMVDPFPDTCNECPTKQNGTYCGRDFAGFPAGDSDMLIGCQLGNVSQNYACPHGCKSNGTAATYNP